MKTFMNLLKENMFAMIFWAASVLLAAGALGATLKQFDSTLQEASSKIYTLEKAMVQMEIIKNDIQQMKEDLKDIKKIVLRPAIGYNGNIDGRLSSSK